MSEENTNDTIRTGADRSLSVGVEFEPGSSLTKQEFRDETDINNVVAQHAVTGQFTHVSAVMPEYGDFSNVNDYQEARNQIKNAELAFAQLPAKVRKRMGNSPATFIEFLEDPDNQEEAVKLGLADPPPPTEAETTDPPIDAAAPIIGGE